MLELLIALLCFFPKESHNLLNVMKMANRSYSMYDFDSGTRLSSSHALNKKTLINIADALDESGFVFNSTCDTLVISIAFSELINRPELIDAYSSLGETHVIWGGGAYKYRYRNPSSVSFDDTVFGMIRNNDSDGFDSFWKLYHDEIASGGYGNEVFRIVISQNKIDASFWCFTVNPLLWAFE